MARTLFLIRAMGVDPVSAHLAEVISTAARRDVVFVCDERRGEVDTGDYARVPITDATLRAMGFSNVPDAWGWLWGDIFYQAASAQFSGYDAYCLIESDVFVPRTGADALVSAMQDSDLDVVATRLRRYDKPPKYSRGLENLGLDPNWGCLFSLSRLSSRAVGAAGALRRKASEVCPDVWINDEAILAGVAQAGELSYAQLEDLLDGQVSTATFENTPPHLYEPLALRERENRIFHPVITTRTILDRLVSGEKKYNRNQLRKVLKMADEPTRERIVEGLKAAGRY